MRTLATTLAGTGVGPRGFVVLALPSSAVSVAAGIAIQALGAACIEVSRELGGDGFAEILRQTEAKVAIVTGRDVGVWTELARTAGLTHLLVVHPSVPGARMVEALDGVAWTWIPDSLPAVGVELPEAAPASPADLDATAPALLVYTSGSTGTPRAVIQTHANIDANTRAIVGYLELTSADRAMATLPLFYCYGRSVLQTHLFVGGSVFFDHRFMYPAVVFDELAAQGCTSFAGVPLTFENLRRQVDVAALELPTLRYVTQAGGAMHPDTIRWVREAFAPAVLFVMYGQTEATSRLAYLPPDRADDKEGSVGSGPRQPRAPHRRRRGPAGRGRRDRQRRRPRPEHHARLLPGARGDRARSFATAGCSPATSAASTRMDSCSSPAGRRSSSSWAGTG